MERTRPVKFIENYPLTSFFALTFLMVWVGLAANISGMLPAFGEWPLSLDGHLTAVFRTRRTLLSWMPNVAAIIILGVIGGWPAVRQLFTRFLKWRVGIKLWLAALLLPLITASVAVGLLGLLGMEVNLSRIGLVPAMLFLRFIFALSTGGIGGEAGWRGFALEHLQQRYTPLKASIVVGIFWALSHLPIVTIRGFDNVELFTFMTTVLCLSIILTWFYNRTQGSLLVVAFVHCLFNAVDATTSRSFVAMLPRKEFMFAFMLVLATAAFALIFATRGRLGKT